MTRPAADLSREAIAYRLDVRRGQLLDQLVAVGHVAVVAELGEEVGVALVRGERQPQLVHRGAVIPIVVIAPGQEEVRVARGGGEVLPVTSRADGLPHRLAGSLQAGPARDTRQAAALHVVRGEAGLAVGLDRFGASAPQKDLYEHFGFTPEAIADHGRKVAKG